MSQRYPNANYPEAYDEANMAKATDVPVNVAGTGLTVTEAEAGYGPLLEHAVTGVDVKGLAPHDASPLKMASKETVEDVAPAAATEFVTEDD